MKFEPMDLPKQQYSHIIWDWNGTLLDDAWLCMEVMNGILQRRNMAALTSERYIEIFGFPILDYYLKLGFDFSREPFETVSSEFVAGYESRRSQCSLREGSAELLEHIYEMGIGQSIISSSQQNYLEEAVEHFGLAGRFESLNGLDNHHAAGKVGIARDWLAQCGTDPAEILLVGDTLHDLETAQAIGVDCALIFSSHQSRSRLTTRAAPLLGSLEEILSSSALALSR